jgi:hypothetical protein
MLSAKRNLHIYIYNLPIAELSSKILLFYLFIYLFLFGQILGDFNLKILVLKMCNLGEKWKNSHRWKCNFKRYVQLSNFGVFGVFDLATVV